eukprot:Gb_03869 [translate_table: standard]
MLPLYFKLGDPYTCNKGLPSSDLCFNDFRVCKSQAARHFDLFWIAVKPTVSKCSSPKLRAAKVRRLMLLSSDTTWQLFPWSGEAVNFRLLEEILLSME